MDNKNLYTIGSSKYDIYSKLLDIAASGEYVTPIDNFENVDFLKSGVFGYVTEALALLMRDSSFHKTMVYRENFLNTAIMPKSIYNWAKMFNVNVVDAVPSSRKAEIVLDVNTINKGIDQAKGSVPAYKNKYGIVENGNFMVIDKSNPIIAGAYTFMLEHSIEIYKNANGQFIVKYCKNEKDVTTEFGNYSNGGIITTLKKTIGNTSYLYFTVDVYQYKVVENTKIISGSSYLDAKVHQFPITGQMCGLALSYTKSNKTENIKLEFSNLEVQNENDLQQKVAYYSIIDDNTLEISFLTNNVSGLPQAGGTLNLRTFITEGINGNISFTGDAVFLIKQDDIKSIPISVTLSKTPITAGLNQTPLSSIKSSIINKLSTRNTIITENDLNSWFASQSKFLENVNHSEITFKKEVDNLLNRTFSAYLLLRDGVKLNEYFTSKSTQPGNESSGENVISVPSSYISSVVPTNTVDAYYGVSSDTTTPGGSADSGTNNGSNKTDKSYIWIHPSDTISYSFNDQKYIISSSSKEKTAYTNDYIFSTPFDIKFNRDTNALSYYYLETSDESELEYYSINNTSDGLILIPTSMSVYKENNKESGYTFNFYFSTDSDLTESVLSEITLIFDNSPIAISKESNNVSFKKLNDTENESLYKNYVLSIKSNNNSIPDITNSERPQITLKFGESNVNVYEKTNIRLQLKLNNNSFDSSFKCVKPISMFSSLSDIMSSSVIEHYDSENKLVGYTIKNIPVVAKYWLDSNINKKWFIKQLFVFINMLKSNLDKLETTTFFNIKFKNTYGISQYYTTTNTMLRLKLNIVLINDKINEYKKELSSGYDTKEALQHEIIDFIRVAVDRANKNKALVISKIISEVQLRYNNFIDHIDFLGLNGTFNQYVKNIEDKVNSSNNYPLEYFNLDNTIDGDNKSRLEKDITFEII